MKKQLSFVLLVVLFSFSSCGSYKSIGDLNMISNRDTGANTEYILLQRNVEGIAKTENSDALERAVDEATKSVTNGEFMKNVKIYVKNNGAKVKVVGDVWGIKTSQTELASTITFNVGDNVSFKKGKKLIEGTIIGINTTSAIVEYNGKKTEIQFESLTKLER